MSPSVALRPGLSVLARGWLHANSVLLHRAGHPPALIDAGYHTGASALVEWISATLDAPIDALDEIVLTHAHSDHGGGVARLVEASGARVRVVEAAAAIITPWDRRRLWLEGGQQMPRFAVDDTFAPGDTLSLGGRAWRVIETPGHMASAVAFYCPEDRVLVTGDALWADGFGMLDPWVEGDDCFEVAAVALDRMSALDVEVVVPGHGPPFTGFGPAIDRARARLERVAADPDRCRVMIARGAVAFLTMGRPELSREALYRMVLTALEAHPPRFGGPAPSARALVDEAFEKLR